MFLLSLPMRERGLKCRQQRNTGDPARSLPMRERGLKYVMPDEDLAKDLSLPMRGAWIEISIMAITSAVLIVAPHAGSVD